MEISDHSSVQTYEFVLYIIQCNLLLLSTFYEHYDDILNFYNNRSSNAAAESFNAKVKSFRAALRGIRDEKFFLYRLSMIYAYPH